MSVKKWVKPLAFTLAATTAITAFIPTTSMANTYTNFDLRKKVVGLSGIMGVSGDLTRKVTRAQFARMLVLASAYKDVLTDSSNVSVFPDVPQGNEYASAIRIAAENGWMTAFLGGNFKPDEYVTLNDAAKGTLYLLGYSADDFEGDQYNRRLSMYTSLELNSNIDYTDGTSVLTLNDCINLFYNLMKCNKKDTNTAYVTVLKGSLSSDGEVDALTMADNSLKGPKVATNKQQVYNTIPFDLDNANIFVNGSSETVTNLLARLGETSGADRYIVLYYSTFAKTVWAYDAGSSDTDRRVVRGKVTNIYYQSTNTLTPSKVEIDESGDSEGSGDGTYALTSSDMQFAFSIYGSLHVGDWVTLIYSVSSDADGNESYTVVDYVEE